LGSQDCVRVTGAWLRSRTEGTGSVKKKEGEGKRGGAKSKRGKKMFLGMPTARVVDTHWVSEGAEGRRRVWEKKNEEATFAIKRVSKRGRG